MNRATYKSYRSTESVLGNMIKPNTNVSLDAMNYATTKEMTDSLGECSLTRSFTLCCKMGLTEMVQMMLDKGVDPSMDNFNAFRFASEQGHDEVLELLIRSIDVQDFNAQLGECLLLAKKYNRKYCIEVLTAVQ